MSKVLRQLSLNKHTRCSKSIRGVTGCYNTQYVRYLYRYRNTNYTTHQSFQYGPMFSSFNKRSYSSADLPQHNRVTLPALSPTMDMGTIISWAKKEGDKLNEGDLLAEIETDKATMGFETPEEGYLAKILIPAGTRDVAIGKLVCIIVENEEDVAAFKDFVDDAPVTKSAPTPPAPAAPKPVPPVPQAPPPVSANQPSFTKSSPISASSGSRIFASPLVKQLAEQQGIDLSSIGSGTGLFGSIKVRDLSRGAKKLDTAQSTAATSVKKLAQGDDFEDLALTTVRQVIAKRLCQSKQTIPHYYLNVDLSLDEIIKLRKCMNEELEKEGVKLTINDFIIKATALASKKVPEANSAWMDSFIRQYYAVDVSVAVNSDKGLITPIIFDAEKKGLIEISSDVKRLAAKAREGTLQPQEFQGGTISVSNLGMFNIKSVSSIINPPQACILGIGSIQKRLVPDTQSPNGMKVSEIVQFSLSCDHRVVDGAVGAQWLQAFRKLIEQPHNMLL